MLSPGWVGVKRRWKAFEALTEVAVVGSEPGTRFPVVACYAPCVVIGMGGGEEKMGHIEALTEFAVVGNVLESGIPLIQCVCASCCYLDGLGEEKMERCQSPVRGCCGRKCTGTRFPLLCWFVS